MKIPDTKEALEAAGYMFDNEAMCRGSLCGKRIKWWITPNGKKMPMSVVEVKDSVLGPVKEYRRIPHWTDCPDAKEFKR